MSRTSYQGFGNIADEGNQANAPQRSRKRRRDDEAQALSPNPQHPSQGTLDQEGYSNTPAGSLLSSQDLISPSANQPASDDDGSLAGLRDTPSGSNNPVGSSCTAQQPGDIDFRSERLVEPWTTLRHALSPATRETLDAWATWRFVKSGCLTAHEAVTYVDLFFQNMSSLSPISHEYYRDHSNHHSLINKEPLLCCTIVALSARYHILSGEGSFTRGYYIHDRLWQHCQSIFQRIVWNQRRVVTDQIRHLGTIESFLLIIEWHPRSAHLLTDDDDWQVDTEAPEDEWSRDHNKGNHTPCYESMHFFKTLNSTK